ncbi:MAG: cobalamin biosynthesis protein CbiX [Betaproteobacteria bacterium]|nr:MAG: cobalamin biosynthesis protein CbiX [Betaproteobacteria bacterium]
MSERRNHGVILFAHGARDAQWADPFRRLRDILQRRAPGVATELAFLEHMRPDLVTAVGRLADQGIERITLVPLFMARGGHLRHDLPQIVTNAAAVHPGVVIRTTDAIGDVASLLEAIADWVLHEHERTGEADLDNPIA